MSDCLFCKFISGEIETEKVYEDESVLGFKDLYPQADIHLLFIHKTHTKNLVELVDGDVNQVQDIFKAISKYSKESGLYEKHFRVLSNVGENAGQSIFHTHFHVLSDKRLGKFGK